MNMNMVVYNLKVLPHKNNPVFSMPPCRLSLIIDSGMKRFRHQAKFNMLLIGMS